MKKTLIYVAVLIAVAGVTYFVSSRPYTNESVSPETQSVVVEPTPTDNVSEAQKQLDEAKKLLDAEEQKILEEIKEKEDRLEKIRQTRLSFSQAPTPAE